MSFYNYWQFYLEGIFPCVFLFSVGVFPVFLPLRVFFFLWASFLFAFFSRLPSCCLITITLVLPKVHELLVSFRLSAQGKVYFQSISMPVVKDLALSCLPEHRLCRTGCFSYMRELSQIQMDFSAAFNRVSHSLIMF